MDICQLLVYNNHTIPMIGGADVLDGNFLPSYVPKDEYSEIGYHNNPDYYKNENISIIIS